MMKKLLVLLAFMASQNAFATHTTFNGLVTQVHDGDTITVNNESGASEKIRIEKLDSPEMPYNFMGNKVPYQPFASESRTNLLNLCLGKIATVVRVGLSGTRTVGNVSCNGTDVANYQISTGYAWVYHFGSTKKTREVMLTAKSHGLGLWSDKNAIDPYYWRKGIRTN